jgi:hypothetical protein
VNPSRRSQLREVLGGQACDQPSAVRRRRLHQLSVHRPRRHDRRAQTGASRRVRQYDGNADQHGEGLIGITIQRQGSSEWSSSVMPDVVPFQHCERISSGSPRRAGAEIYGPAPAWVPP